MLNTIHLARYKLPDTIHIQLRNADGTPYTRSPVPVMVEYGYQLPPLRSNEKGRLLITKEMFIKAKNDLISTGIMDYKGDYSLNRFVHIRVLGKSKAAEVSNARLNSQWPILEFEKELYGNLRDLGLAYIPNEEIIPIETKIDLSQTNDVVELELVVSNF